MKYLNVYIIGEQIDADIFLFEIDKKNSLINYLNQ